MAERRIKTKKEINKIISEMKEKGMLKDILKKWGQ